MSKLYFSYAAMNAGKSTVLLQASWNYQERGMRTLLFTSAHYAKTTDARASWGDITSRIGISARARAFSQADDLYAWISREHRSERISCVFLDEAQFLTRDQVWQLARVADRLDIPVLCYGLRTDFQGKLFPGAAELLAIADSLREIRTICHCGRKATMVVRRTPEGKTLTTGDQVAIEKSMYVSLCRRHWEEETGRWPAAKPNAGKPNAGKPNAGKPKGAKPAQKKPDRKKLVRKKRPALRIAAARGARPPRTRR